MIQTENLCCNLIAPQLPRLHRYSLKLCIRLGQHFHIIGCAHHCITLQAQHGAQHVKGLFLVYRLFRNEIDGAFNARINNEGIARVMADSAHHRFNISANEIQRRLIRGWILRSGQWRDEINTENKKSTQQSYSVVIQARCHSAGCHVSHLNSSAMMLRFPC